MTENMSNNEIKIESLIEFLKEISGFANKKIVYRGQSNKEWDVTSSAYRRLIKEDSTALLDYNKELIERARRYSDEFKETITDIHLLAKLQHYGAATSLIDFTESALTALWFACQDGKTDGKVFCLDISSPTEFLEVSSEDEEKNIEKILTLEFRERKDSINSIDKIAKWQPSITDKRILKQDSFFIFNRTEILKSNKFIKTIVITKNKVKEKILKELEQINNLSEETIFPDFYGFAQNNSANKFYGAQSAEEYFRQGHASHREGEFKKAIEHYSKAIELNPKDPATYSNRGIVKSALGLQKEAMQDYDKAIEIDPQFINAYIGLGSVKHASGRYDEAIKDYDIAIEFNPQFTEVYTDRGNAKSALGLHKEAMQDYDKAIEIDPQFINAYIGLGSVKHASGRYDEAIKDYDKAIELNPQFINAYIGRGSVKYASGRYDEAIRDFDIAIEFNPQFTEVYTDRGNAKLALGKREEAIKDYDKAIELNPQFINAYIGRGIEKYALKQCKEAIQDYNRAIELNPQLAEAYNNRGAAKSDLGRHDEAIQDYDIAIELNPQLAEAYNNRGNTKSNSGRPKEAIMDYEIAKNLYESEGNMEMAKKCENRIADLIKLMKK